MKKYRLESIEKEMARVIGKLLYEEVRNPKIKGIISVMRVNVTPDLKYADVYVSILPLKNEEINKKEEIMEGFDEIRGFIRKKLASEIRLRYIPEVRIKLDDTIEYGIKINKILNELKVTE